MQKDFQSCKALANACRRETQHESLLAVDALIQLARIETRELTESPPQVGGSVEMRFDLPAELTPHGSARAALHALREAEWFHVEKFPTARFVTERIDSAPDGYIADALLTLRDQTRPVALRFSLEPLSDGRLRFTGQTLLQRLDFGVGQGQWTNTDWVGNDVTISVSLVLEPALP